MKDIWEKDIVLSVEDKPVLVGNSTDGAAANIGKQSGLRGCMQRALPGFFGAGVGHRLQLACKDAFSSSLFSSIEEMLLRLYYRYQKLPKKSQELAMVVDDLKQA